MLSLQGVLKQLYHSLNKTRPLFQNGAKFFYHFKFGHRPKQFDKDYTWIDGQAMGGDITMQWLET